MHLIGIQLLHHCTVAVYWIGSQNTEELETHGTIGLHLLTVCATFPLPVASESMGQVREGRAGENWESIRVWEGKPTVVRIVLGVVHPPPTPLSLSLSLSLYLQVCYRLKLASCIKMLSLSLSLYLLKGSMTLSLTVHAPPPPPLCLSLSLPPLPPSPLPNSFPTLSSILTLCIFPFGCVV